MCFGLSGRSLGDYFKSIESFRFRSKARNIDLESIVELNKFFIKLKPSSSSSSSTSVEKDRMHSRYRKFKSHFNLARQKKNTSLPNEIQKTKGPKQEASKQCNDNVTNNVNELRQRRLYTRFNSFYSKLQEEFDKLDLSKKGAQERAKEVNNNNKNNEVIDDLELEEDEQSTYLKRLKKICFTSFTKSLAKHNYRLYSSSSSFIAEGGFGKVVRVYHQDKKFACKIIANLHVHTKTKELVPVPSAKMKSRFANEVEIMRRVTSHPNIISFVDSFHDQIMLEKTGEGKQVKFSLRDVPDDFEPIESDLDEESEVGGEGKKRPKSIHFKTCYIIMEYANNKTLSEYIKNEDRLSEAAIRQAFSQVLNAINYLHRLKIVHRDIKLSNMLLFKGENGETLNKVWKYSIKLCDFGLSSIIEEGDDGCFMKPVGTAIYMSPEILHSYYHYNRRQIDRILPYDGFKADIWAVGVCMFYCLNGAYPLEMACKSKQGRLDALGKIFGEGESNVEEREEAMNKEKLMNITEAQTKLIRKELRKYDADKISIECSNVLDSMLEIDPANRASVEVLLKYDFFK